MAADELLPLISQLTKGARASYSFLRSLALKTPELAKSAILDQLNEAGFGIRRQTGLDLIDLIRDRGSAGQFIRTFGSDAPLPISAHSKSPHGISGGNRYQYLVGTNSSNPLTPEAVYVNSLTPLSENQIFDLAAATFHYENETGLGAGMEQDAFFSIDEARTVLA